MSSWPIWKNATATLRAIVVSINRIENLSEPTLKSHLDDSESPLACALKIANSGSEMHDNGSVAQDDDSSGGPGFVA